MAMIVLSCSSSLWDRPAIRASLSADSCSLSRNFSSGSVIVRSTCRESELSAAAFLRARCFYSYPEGRSIEAQAVAGEEAGFGRVACLVALIPHKTLSFSQDDFCETCKVTVAGQDFLVVGTLDVNQGRQIPGEIPGSRPKDTDPTYKRAYISNFCVAREARRRGLGTALVDEAKRTAKEWGVSDLYVHVVITNDPAFKLYLNAGFAYESEEAPALAHMLDRPRRKLLWSGV